MSRESLLSRYKATHEGYMKQILALLFSSEFKDVLGFKGGTLAYLCYVLDRFSTDLDIDLLELDQEQAIIAFLNTELPLLGDSKRPLLGKDLHRRKFAYNQLARNIKIELNKRQNPYTTYEYKTIDDIHIQCQTAPSMVTNKLIALGKRRYNRDLYDTHFFLKKSYQYDEAIVKERTGLPVKKYIQNLIQEIPQQFTDNAILHQIGEVLETDKQKSRVKHHLINDTIKLLNLYLE